jgi:hypothetical protein
VQPGGQDLVDFAALQIGEQLAGAAQRLVALLVGHVREVGNDLVRARGQPIIASDAIVARWTSTLNVSFAAVRLAELYFRFGSAVTCRGSRKPSPAMAL